MDLIELARTIQADKNRAIAAEITRRRLTTTTHGTARIAPSARQVSPPQRSASTGALSR